MAPGIFADRDNPVSYSALARFFEICGQRLNRDDLGPAGRPADPACRPGPRRPSWRSAGRPSRRGCSGSSSITTCTTPRPPCASRSRADMHSFVWAIAEHGISSTRHIQLAAMTIAFNFMQDLCGTAWLPAVVTVASRSPANPQPCHRFFRAPVRFDSDESAMIFERRWLDRPLPPVDPQTRQQDRDRSARASGHRGGQLPGHLAHGAAQETADRRLLDGQRGTAAGHASQDAGSPPAAARGALRRAARVRPGGPRTATAARHDDAGAAGRRGAAILERRQFRHRLPPLDGRDAERVSGAAAR